MSLGSGDLQVILRRIRHGFIICDDTELCDKIISQDAETEQRRRNFAKTKSIDIDKTDLLTLLRNEPDFIADELSHSPEWTATNVQVQRRRCETLGRLDEIKTENEAKRKVQIISWQNPKDSNSLSNSENDEDDTKLLFQRRTDLTLPLKKPSPLTLLLKSSLAKQNPYEKYAVFDGTANRNPNETKKFIVHIIGTKQKLNIIVVSRATVEETIGLICYKYIVDNREPVLTQNEPSKFLLHIADEDGQAEVDFPPLTNSRPIDQFSFPHLALVVKENDPDESKTLSSNSDEIPFDDDDDDDGSLNDSSRPITPSLSESSKLINSPKESSVPATNAHSSQNEVDPINNLNRLYESLNQKVYFMDYYIKSGGNKHVKVRLDVSGEQIRFELLEKTTRLTWQTMSLTTQRVVDCDLIDKDPTKKRDHARIYLVFEGQHESDRTHAYQTYEFESRIESAEQFQDQIHNIIQLKSQQAHEIYKQQHPQNRRDPIKKRRSIFNILGGGHNNSGSSSKS